MVLKLTLLLACVLLVTVVYCSSLSHNEGRARRAATTTTKKPTTTTTKKPTTTTTKKPTTTTTKKPTTTTTKKPTTTKVPIGVKNACAKVQTKTFKACCAGTIPAFPFPTDVTSKCWNPLYFSLNSDYYNNYMFNNFISSDNSYSWAANIIATLAGLVLFIPNACYMGCVFKQMEFYLNGDTDPNYPDVKIFNETAIIAYFDSILPSDTSDEVRQRITENLQTAIAEADANAVKLYDEVYPGTPYNQVGIPGTTCSFTGIGLMQYIRYYDIKNCYPATDADGNAICASRVSTMSTCSASTAVKQSGNLMRKISGASLANIKTSETSWSGFIKNVVIGDANTVQGDQNKIQGNENTG